MRSDNTPGGAGEGARCLLLGLILGGALLVANLLAARPADGALSTLTTAGVRATLKEAALTMEQGDRLLAQRDAAPAVVRDPGWQGDYAGLLAALEAERRSALEAPQAPPGGDLARCASEALRLSLAGYRFLGTGYGHDGHGAYYFGAHGTWELELGRSRLASCRAQLG